MKYTRNERKDDKIVVNFELNAKEWEAEVEAAYQKNKGKYKKEGFRQGKVPRKVLENTYGKYMFYEDAFNDAFPKFYTDMLKKEKDIYPIDYPQIGVDKMDEKGVKFTATIEVLPEFKVEKYTGFEIKKGKIDVKKADIQAELDMLAKRHCRYVEITDREVKNGDLVNLNYCGKIDGVAFEGGTAEDQELEIGSGTFIPGFEEQMVGMKIGEEKDLKVKFPETYHAENLAGKDAIFTVKVLGIREKQIPEINDDFAKEVSEFDSLQALTLSIEERQAKEKAEEIEHKAENDLLKAIVDGVDFKVPAKMVDKQLDYYMHDLEHRMAMQGLTKEMYFKFTGTTEENLRKERRKDAERSVKTGLVLDQIVEKEGIKATAKDIDAKLEEIAKMYNQTKEEIKSMLEENGNMASVEQEVVNDKVIKFLKENNKIA